MAKSSSRDEVKVGQLIRKRRKQLNLTLQALCDKAEISVGYLSVLERDNALPTLATLAQISMALQVPLDYFISTPKPTDALSRAQNRPQFSIKGSNIVYESLGASFPGSELSCYVIHIPPGYQSEIVHHEGEEILYVLEGEIHQSLGGQNFRLTKGDSLHYSGNTLHAWNNPTDEPVVILWVGTLIVLQRTGSHELPEMSPLGQSEKN